jgi:hypothetical protein
MKFITHKPTFSKFLISVKFRLRKTNIYLFPQGWGVTEAAAKVRYEGDHFRHA